MQGYDNLDCDDNVRKNYPYHISHTYIYFHYWSEYFKAWHTFSSISRYAGEYVPDGRQFIVVAGNINYETVQVKLS